MRLRPSATDPEPLGLACLAAALVLVGCNALWGTDQLTYRSAQGGSGGGTNSGGGSGGGGSGGVTTTTTTSAGGGGAASPCDEPVFNDMGETQACRTCIAEQCCNEYEACIDGDCDALMTCGEDENRCGPSCLYEVCNSGMALPFAKYCADCLGAACCDSATDCANDAACMDCLAGNDETCSYTSLDNALNDCTDTNCGAECGGTR